ncbi:MAG: endolytic transglycosylase MltG, partial [Candidatus Latescibacterota bacterium]
MNISLPKGPLLIAFILLIVMAITAIALLGIAVFLNAPTGKSMGAVLDIPKGMTAKGIAHMLREREIIRSELLFCLVSRSRGYSSRYKAGRFRIPREMRTADIARYLVETPPGPVDIRITVPEGYNIREIASILQKKAGVDSSSFVMFAMNSAIAESL